MRMGIVLIMITLALGLNAQSKVKIKKKVISVDGLEMYKIDMSGNAAFPIYTISDLEDNKLLIADQIMHFAYFEGPRENYFKLHTIDRRDSCLVQWQEANSRKKIVSLIINNNLLSEGKLNVSAFEMMRSKYKQDFVSEFLEKHQLSYDKLIARGKNATFSLAFEDNIKLDSRKKYAIRTVGEEKTKTIGYMQNGYDYEIKKKFFKIYLPNGLEVARINPPETKMRGVKYITKKDGEIHDTSQSLNKIGFLHIVNELSKLGYL